MNAKELIDKLSANPTSPLDLAATSAAALPIILRALRLLAAAEGWEAMASETPVTDATFERLAAQDGPENLYTDEQVETIQFQMGEMERRAKAMEKAISGWILKTVERETLDEVAADYRAWEVKYGECEIEE